MDEDIAYQFPMYGNYVHRNRLEYRTYGPGPPKELKHNFRFGVTSSNEYNRIRGKR